MSLKEHFFFESSSFLTSPTTLLCTLISLNTLKLDLRAKTWAPFHPVQLAQNVSWYKSFLNFQLYYNNFFHSLKRRQISKFMRSFNPLHSFTTNAHTHPTFIINKAPQSPEHLKRQEEP